MAGPALLSVETARAAILAKVPRERPVEWVGLSHALGRTLAADLSALLTQPPIAVSAMDGYALRAADLGSLPRPRLAVIGESAAGSGFGGRLAPGQCVRIFTGAPVPEGADAVLMQEDARIEGDGALVALKDVAPGSFVRAAGLDFSHGDRLLVGGTRLGPLEIALAAAMNHAVLPVVRRPRVAILTTGDELVPPGEVPGPGRIVASNAYAIAALVEAAGGEARDLGIARDRLDSLEAGIDAALTTDTDILVTLGGASVGDRDLVKPALERKGMEIDFWRVAMRPGRPLIHGTLGSMTVIGLPGNPVAAAVTGIVFLCPLLRALSGDPAAHVLPTEPARLGAALPENDSRADYLRAKLWRDPTGVPVATPVAEQDSSLLRVLATADCLVIRPAFAPAAGSGDPCLILRLPGRV